MSLLYLTADALGAQSGGGRVTQEESTALADFAVEQNEEFFCWGRNELSFFQGEEPWRWDLATQTKLIETFWNKPWPRLCHIYAGTFSLSVTLLKRHGCRIVYTIAAHDVAKSRQAHHELGIDYDRCYPHLVQPDLWQRYAGGYFNADLVICPSQHSAAVVKEQGCQRVQIIPHGVDIPKEMVPPPRGFVCGYLGSYGADKGVIDLLRAWKQIAHADDLLVLAGKDSLSPFVHQLLDHLEVHHVDQIGWLDDVSGFYRGISCYCQCSRTEGFSLEVLEAMAHGRAVICSSGAGAADAVADGWRYPAGNVDALAVKINQFRSCDLAMMGRLARQLAKAYEWPLIRELYQETWTKILS